MSSAQAFESDPATEGRRVRARFRRDESRGWGLLLVERIADRWGTSRTASGTCVWFELQTQE